MATNPIDQLFREKLVNSELKPSAEAWEMLQQRTQKKGSIGFLRIAAAVALLCTAGISLWWFQNPGQNGLSMGTAIDITAPIPLASNQLMIPERSSSAPVPKESLKNLDPLKPTQKDEINIPTVENQYIATETPMIKPTLLQVTDLVVLSMDVPPLDFELDVNDKINIFYYTQATPTESDASKKKLAKIIDYARTTNPVDWVGDFRNKKDEWLDNVFSLDE